MIQEKTIEVYITRYVLTKGIQKIKVKTTNNEDMVKDCRYTYWVYYQGEGRDWHKTYESASKRAEKVKKNKIASLKKQLERLEKLIF